MGFVNIQKKVSFKSVSSEVYFWRENPDEISPGQIGYCALAALGQFGSNDANRTNTSNMTKNKGILEKKIYHFDM